MYTVLNYSFFLQTFMTYFHWNIEICSNSYFIAKLWQSLITKDWDKVTMFNWIFPYVSPLYRLSDFPNTRHRGLYLWIHIVLTQKVSTWWRSLLKQKEEICLNLQAEWLILPILNGCKTAAVVPFTGHKVYSGHGKNYKDLKPSLRIYVCYKGTYILLWSMQVKR